ncbi:hypothetical protein MKW98_031142 [Papaver atlanticum]|uniref:Uncharacterized protein n=1 Tax=Papaver atlanticum TaxID=357466 RepID=A0AAD4XLC5_9MAGN|nr:hypothetical protein MKW98_031142 [Papaver atlanticum]
MFGLCEGALVDEVEDEEEDPLENENAVEKEDLFEKGEEEDLVESQTVFEPKVVVDDKVSDSHKTMLDNVECLTAEIKSMKDKIGEIQTCIVLSKTKTGTPPEGHYEEGDLNGEAMQNLDGTPPKGHYEEGDFNGEAMQKLDVSPGDGSNNSELSPLYPYNPPNKEVDVSRPVAENICNSSTGKKRKRQENKPCTGHVAPVIDVSDDVTKVHGRDKRKINPSPPMLSPYTPTGKVVKKNAKKPVIINYFEEDILDQRITKKDIDDVNRFINLGIKEHGDNYNGDGTSLFSFHEYKLLLRSTGWLCGNTCSERERSSSFFTVHCPEIMGQTLQLEREMSVKSGTSFKFSFFSSFPVKHLFWTVTQ